MARTRLFSLFTFLSFSLLDVSASPLVERTTFAVGQAVKTTSGTVVGHAAQTRNQVSEYLGIPFAQPPIGNLRFAAPQPFNGTTNSTIIASTYSPDCPANTDNSALSDPAFLASLAGVNAVRLLAELGQVGDQQSEDCLTLNVWTKPQTGETAKAVLFWLYGGGFATGTTDSIGYNGQYFADNQDVIVVSANYRLNAFGFPGLPGASIPQNPGLLDQRLAIEWVRDNIAAFGGDPNRITLFGQSAGGASVDYYNYAYTQDPIVNAFIAESGTATSFMNPPTPNNTQAWFNASQSLGCGDSSVGVEQSIACIRTKSFTDVLAAIVVADPLKAVLGNFGPTVDNTVVFSDYDSRAASGQFIKKPYFTGNNNYEAGLFRVLASAAGETISDVDWCLFNLETFTCPAAKAAKARAAASVPTYRYRYFGEFPNMRLTTHPNSGAWHGSEIDVVWGTSVDATGVANTAAETSISNYLQGAWAAFAKDPVHAFTKAPYSFPKYNPNALTPSLIQFANNNVTAPTYAYPLTTDLLCPVLDAVAAVIPGGLTGSVFSTGSISDLNTIPGASSIPGFSSLVSLINQLANSPLPNPSQCPPTLG